MVECPLGHFTPTVPISIAMAIRQCGVAVDESDLEMDLGSND